MGIPARVIEVSLSIPARVMMLRQKRKAACDQAAFVRTLFFLSTPENSTLGTRHEDSTDEKARSNRQDLCAPQICGWTSKHVWNDGETKDAATRKSRLEVVPVAKVTGNGLVQAISPRSPRSLIVNMSGCAGERAGQMSEPTPAATASARRTGSRSENVLTRSAIMHGVSAKFAVANERGESTGGAQPSQAQIGEVAANYGSIEHRSRRLQSLRHRTLCKVLR